MPSKECGSDERGRSGTKCEEAQGGCGMIEEHDEQALASLEAFR